MRYLLFIFVILLSCVTFGQKTPNLPKFLSHLVVKGTKGDAYDNTKKNFAHFFAIALSFDSTGKIDTLYYSSKLDSNTRNLYSLDNSLLIRIKKYNFTYKEYASRTALIPFYFYNISDNYVDYQNGFLNNLEHLLPEAIYGKPILILKPIIDANVPRQTEKRVII